MSSANGRQNQTRMFRRQWQRSNKGTRMKGPQDGEINRISNPHEAAPGAPRYPSAARTCTKSRPDGPFQEIPSRLSLVSSAGSELTS